MDERGDVAATDAPDDLTDQPAVGESVVAVSRARLVGGCCRSEGLGHVLPVEQAIAGVHEAADPVKACGMGEHVAHGDGLFAVGRELRPVGGHRFVVVDQPAVGQYVQSGRGDPLGRGEAHRDGVVPPRFVVGPFTTPQVHHGLTPVVDAHGGSARAPA